MSKAYLYEVKRHDLIISNTVMLFLFCHFMCGQNDINIVVYTFLSFIIYTCMWCESENSNIMSLTMLMLSARAPLILIVRQDILLLLISITT